jgi:L-methionine (R)-S-oxide reductase
MTLVPDFDQLLDRVEEITIRSSTRDQTLQAICTLLRKEVPHYNWVGFYLTDADADQELVLGPYEGAATEHTRIPFGKGICGQAAATEQTFIVQDVSQETNYLSCSPDVLAEIVVPILREGVVLGELDIDSHALAPFGGEDREFLEDVCDLVAPLL